jgi:NAD(P)-dependent dehydrogenase (short-subunit alcohol dehydrogenase family)
MEYKNKVAVVTGGAHGIGKCIAEEFQKRGASVAVIDVREGDHFVGDISNKEVLEAFADEVIGKYGKVDFIVNNAMPLMKGLDECTWEEFQYALAVGVTAPFYLVKLLAPYLAEGASIVNISSSRDRMSQPQTESYTAAKGGIAALTHALAVTLRGKARVNSISPDGLTLNTRNTRVQMLGNSRQDVWATRWTSPIWCCSFAQAMQDSLQARISASTVA